MATAFRIEAARKALASAISAGDQWATQQNRKALRFAELDARRSA